MKGVFYIKKYDGKKFRKENFFVMYDLNDNLVNYFDNFEELRKIFNMRLAELVYKYNNSLFDYVVIVSYDTKYKLFTYTDKDLQNLILT